MPARVLVVRRGAVTTRSLIGLYADSRIEVAITDELTNGIIATARSAEFLLVATDGDPLDALVYAVTARIGKPIVMLIDPRYKEDVPLLIEGGAMSCEFLPVRDATTLLDRMLA